MNEEELKVYLESQGYNYKNGFITDSEGLYQKSVEIDGEQYESFGTQEDWDNNIEADISIDNLIEERKVKEDKVLADKQALIDYEEDPLNSDVDKVEEETFNSVQEENHKTGGKPSYYDIEDFKEENLEKAMKKDLGENLGDPYNSLQDATVFNTLKNVEGFEGLDMSVLQKIGPINKNIKLIEKEDADVDTIIESILAEKSVKKAWYNPSKYGDMLFDAIYAGVAGITPDGVGMKDEEKKKEYLGLLEERKTFIGPEIEKIRDVIDTKLEPLNETLFAGRLGKGEPLSDLKNLARRRLQIKSDYLTDYINDSNFHSPLTEEFVGGALTFGTREAYDKLVYELPLANKIDNIRRKEKLGEEISKEEELTEDEAFLLNTLGTIDLLNGLDIKQNPLYNFSSMAEQSTLFVGGGMGGRLLGGGVKKMIVGGATKGIARGGFGRMAEVFVKSRLATSKLGVKYGLKNIAIKGERLLGSVVDVGVQGILHPASAVTAVDNMTVGFHMIEDAEGKTIIRTGREEYKALENDIEKYEEAINKQGSSMTKEMLSDTKEQLKNLKNILRNTQKPMEGVEATASGVVGSMLEAYSEKYLFKSGGALLKPLKKTKYGRLASRKWGKILGERSKVGKIFNKLNNPLPKTMKAINNFTGENVGGDIIGGNVEEILEEVFVQAIPVWGETDAQAKQRKSELLKGEFYAGVMFSAPFQKLLMSPVGIGKRVFNYTAPNFSKDTRESKANFKSLMKELEKEGITKGDMKIIMMAAGSGNFSQIEIKNNIKELDDKGDTETANKIRENRVFNAAMSAVKLGKGKQFLSSLEKSLANQNKSTASPQSEAANITATVKAIAEVKAIIKDTKELEGFPNHEYALELKRHLRARESNITSIEKEVSHLESQEQSKERDSKIELLKQSKTDTQKSIYKLNKALNVEKSPLKRKAYQDENLMRQFAKLKLKENRKGPVSAEKSKLNIVDEIKKTFKGRVSRTSITKVTKEFEIYNILETAQAEIKENGQVAKEKNTEASQEHIPEEHRGEQLPASENPFAAEAEVLVENTTAIIGEMEEQDDTSAFLDSSVDEMINSVEVGKDDHPIKKLGNQMKNFVESVEKRTGKKPAFEDFLSSIAGYGKIENLQDFLNLFGAAWYTAGLGKVDVQKKLQNAIDMANDAAQAEKNANLIEVSPETKEELKEEQKQEEKALGMMETETEVVKRDINGIPIIEDTQDELYSEEHKIHYSVLEFENTETKEGEETFHDKTNGLIPTLRKGAKAMLNLVHPSKNNKGATIKSHILENTELGEQMVSIRGEFGDSKKSVTFEKWVELNRGEMTPDEFSKTDKYIGKVPIQYKDKNGNVVGYVGEVSWHSASTEGTIVGKNKTQVSNLSEVQKRTIEKKRVKALELRKNILSGKITEFKITSDGTSFVWLKIDKSLPPKSLHEVAQSSQIVMMQEDHLVDLQGNIIETKDIMNWGDEESGHSKKKLMVSEDGKTKEIQGVNSGGAAYIEHTTTINGVKKYVIISALEKNEDNKNQASNENIETVRLLSAANTVLMGGIPYIPKKDKLGNPHPYFMTKAQAQQVHDQVKEITGLSLSDNLSTLVESLIKEEVDAKGKLKYKRKVKEGSTKVINGLEIARMSWRLNDETGESAIPNENYRNNIKYSKTTMKKGVVAVKRESNGAVSVTKIGDSYEDYLKKKVLTTNVMGYNIGTEENPISTPAIQQKVIVVAVETKTLSKPSERTIKEKEVQIKEVKKEIKTEVEESQEVEAEIQGNTEVSTVPSEIIDNAIETLSEMNVYIPSDTSDELLSSEMNSTEAVEDGLDLIEGISIEEEGVIVNNLMKLLADKEMTFEEVLSTLTKELEERKVKIKKSISELEAHRGNMTVDKIFYLLEKTLSQIETLEKEKHNLLTKASEIGQRENFIVDEYEETEGENVKNYSKKSNESLPVDKIGTALKRIFAQVETGETGFLGFSKIAPFKSLYDSVLLELSSSIGVDTDFNTMMEILSQYSDSNPWMKSLIENLDKADESVQNAFVYNMHNQKVMAHFSMFSKGKNKLEGSLYGSNSNTAVRVIKENWVESFKRSAIVKNNFIDKNELQRLHDEFFSWTKEDKQNVGKMLAYLGAFGVHISEKTMEQLMANKLKVVSRGGVAESVEYKTLFTTGIFAKLNAYAVNKKNSDKDVPYSIENLPLNNIQGMSAQLAYLEAKNNTRYASTSRRVAGKSVTEVENMTYFYQQIRKIKNSLLNKTDYINKLRSLSFSKDSYMLRMLQEDPAFTELFDHGFMDLMSLKEKFKSNPLYGAIEELSEEDYQLALRLAFQTKGAESKLDEKTGFNVRIAHMNTMTNSDKGRMMLLKTFVYDFYGSSTAFEENDKGDINFSEGLNQLMYDNYVMPELRRMVNFINKGAQTDIKGYTEGAQRFNIFPILNTLTNEQGVTIKNSVLSKLGEGNKTEEEIENILSSIQKEFKTVTTKAIEDNTMAEAKRVVLKRKGLNDETYKEGRKKVVSKANSNLMAELDFILNSKLTSMNYMQMIAGDPALYYKSKISNVTTNIKEATKASVESAINLGKRMAAMIAPGKVLAGSKGNKYLQLFMGDINGAASNLMDIIKWHYPKNDLNKIEEKTGESYKNLIEFVIKNGLDDKTRKLYVNILQDEFSNIAKFIDIESTDAQEYTTVKEHLYVLEKQGRLPQELINEVRAKIKAQQDFYKIEGNRGKTIPKEMSLSSIIESKNKAIDGFTQLKILLQPIKPVYTGSLIEGDVNRIMYIKSSSFPLIPELTSGMGLDALRVQMERLEIENPNLTVRASYQTANKVGALTGDKTIKNFTDPITTDNGLVLNREDFKIQQDVPFKSNKEGGDVVSMGTQIFKLLFGDGMIDLDGFEYDNSTKTGEELHAEFFKVYSEMVNLKKEELLESLYLSSDMKPIEEKKAKKALQQLLIKEGKSRGFSRQDIKALSFVSEKNLSFKIPLWFTGNSNKFESMLNALINNKIFKQKIPGNKFVTGSEAGFETEDNIKSFHRSRIINIGGKRKGPLKSTTTKDGKIIKAEILLPSKFKLGGKLIDIYEAFDETTGQGTYIELIDEVYQLKEDMIDPKLLEQFVFRIPTSSHGLGSAVKVVGFLPPESGDLIITPKGFIAQMGQDFDIDSLTAYQYNHIVNSDGSLSKLTEDNVEYFIEDKKQEIETLKELLRSKGKYEKEVNTMFNALMGTIFDEKIELKEYTETEIYAKIDLLKKELKNTGKRKILENKFIEMHLSVFSNPKSQKLINKALSMDFAEQQAADIESLLEENGGTFDMLSPEYQRIKMKNGSTGQDAIGIYAKGVTLHSAFQQATKTSGKEIHLQRKGKPLSITIGKLHSTGKFGLKETLSSLKNNKLSRLISTVMDERTNTGTDNEKAQILGKTGLNHRKAIAVDSMLSLLGFDAEHEILTKEEYVEGEPFHRIIKIEGKTIYYKEYSIPYLLHSQPIIKEYFDLLNTKGSISTKISINASEEALAELLEKYSKKGYGVMNGKYGIRRKTKDGVSYIENTQDNSKMTGKNLANNIALGHKTDYRKQMEVLALYLDLIKQAEGVKEASQLIDMNNLGKSSWEAEDKIETFKNYFSSLENSNINNIEALLGEIMYGEEGKSMEGSIDLGDGMYLIPSAPQGLMTGTALSLSHHLFEGLFPAKSEYLKTMMDKIFAVTKTNIDNSFSRIKAKEYIFQEVKKYITSAKMLGLFNTNAKEVRENLFFGRQGSHSSLSSYIANTFDSESREYENGIMQVRNNLFLNLLNFKKGEHGKPDLITFNNQESFEANQEAIYTAVKQLLVEDITLPPIMRNGVFESYSTRKLTQDLIAYSYTSGGVVQGALEFHKFLPIEYLEDMTETITGNKGTSSSVLHNLFNNGKEGFIDAFEQQFYQHNPQLLKQKNLESHKTEEGEVYYTTESQYPTLYLAKKNSTRDKTKQGKWKIFKYNDGIYTEIPVLGELGMSEYEYDKKEVSSSIGEKEFTLPQLTNLELETMKHNTLGEVPTNGSTNKSFLERIIQGEFGEDKNIQEIAKFLLPLIKDNETFNMLDTGYAKGSTTFEGKISIMKNRHKTREELTITFVHESLHNLTARYITEFLDEKGKLTDKAPSEMRTFMLLFAAYKNNLRKLDPEKYDTFIKEYEDYRDKRAKNERITDTQFTLKGGEFDVYYAMVNPKEFLAVSLSNNKDFLQIANKMDYMALERGFIRKFADIITRIVNSIVKRENLSNKTLSAQILKSSLQVTRAGAKFNKKNEKKETLKISNKTVVGLHETLVEQERREAMEGMPTAALSEAMWIEEQEGGKFKENIEPMNFTPDKKITKKC